MSLSRRGFLRGVGAAAAVVALPAAILPETMPQISATAIRLKSWAHAIEPMEGGYYPVIVHPTVMKALREHWPEAVDFVVESCPLPAWP